MFELSKQEFATLEVTICDLQNKMKSDCGILLWHLPNRALPCCPACLTAIALYEVNIQIMRVFTRLRQILLGNKDLKRELEELRRVTDERFRIVFTTLDQLLSTEERPKRKIGFTVKEKAARYRVEKKKTKNNPVHSLRGKYKGSGLVKSLMAEKKCEREL